LALLFSTIALPVVAFAQTPGFWLVGFAPETQGSNVFAISGDGTTASGQSSDGTFPYTGPPGFTWTVGAGRVDFNEPGLSPAFALSADGSVAAGGAAAVFGEPVRPYRRQGVGLLELLNNASGYTRGHANGISGDGTVVVGTSQRGPNSLTDGQAFRWTSQTGTVGLGYLRPSSFYSEAQAISGDGSTIVGSSHQFGPGGPVEAYAWTAQTGMRALPQLPGAANVWTIASGISSSGEFIVGEARTAAGRTFAARWSSDESVRSLGTWSDYAGSQAYAVSDNGMVVAGTLGNSQSLQPGIAFAWTEAAGMEPLAEYLIRNGVDVPTGWRLDRCVAMSSDGLTFGGTARGPSGAQGFVATIPAPCPLVVVLGYGVRISRRRR